MIDWSSSDYTIADGNLLYIPDIEGGVYLNKNNDLNEHLCYECKDTNKKIELTEVEQVSDEFTIKNQMPQMPQVQQKEVEKQMPQIQYVPIMQPYIQPQQITFQPHNRKSNFIGGLTISNEMSLIFIALVLFLVYVELRISNIYKKMNDQNYRNVRTS